VTIRAVLALSGISTLLSGCVAAAIPLAAGGLMARNELRGRPTAEPKDESTAVDRAQADPFAGGRVVSAYRGELPRPDGTLSNGAPAPVPLPSPSSPQESGEAASGPQSYQALWTYLATRAADRKNGIPLNSVILAADARPEAPNFEPCGQKPLAAILDIDENVALDPANSDPDARWRLWKGDGSDAVVAMPGVAEGIAAAEREGVTPIFISGRSATGAPGIIALLEQLGFGQLQLGRTLWLRGGTADPQAGDDIRRAIAADYCVVALVGDQPSEFSDLFAGTETTVPWAGWFLLPNPVHSTIMAKEN